MRKLYSKIKSRNTASLALTAILVILGIGNAMGQTILISPTGDGGFESGSTFAANGWTSVNASTSNSWAVGTATPSLGTRSAYISNNSGTSYSYTNSASSVTHFYRDITFPIGETKITLTFKLRGDGDLFSGTYYDKLLVYTAPSTFTPVNTAPTSSGTALSGATLVYSQAANYGAAYTLITVTLPSSLAGTTSRLIFSWHCDGSGGTTPGSIDEISLVSAAPLNRTSTSSGGNWSSTATWVGGIVPDLGDSATIVDGATVTIDMNPSIQNLIVGGGTSGILEYSQTTARTLTVNGNVTINAGGTFRSNTAGTVTTHVLSLARNLTNNGTLDFSTNTNTAGAGITFTGSANQTVSGTGGTTDLFSVSMSKSALANEVDFNLSNFSVRGLSSSASGALLTSGSGTGTIKFSGTNTFSGVLWSATSYTIPSTLAFWLNNPNFTVQGLAGSPTLSGTLRISNGIYTIGTSNNSMGFSSGATVLIEGGIVNAVARFGVASASNNVNYTQTGGTVYVNSLAGNASTTLRSFDLGTSSSTSFTMSGGSIVVSKGSANTELRGPTSTSATINITGGTIQFGNSTVTTPSISFTPTSTTFRIEGLLPSIVLNSTNNPGITQASNITVYGDITLNGTGTYSNNFSSLTIRGNSVSNPGNITLNTGSVFTINTSNTQNLAFSSSFGNQTLTNSGGTITSSQLPSVTINNTFSGGIVTIPTGLSLMSGSTLTLTAGAFHAGSSGGGTISLGTAAAGTFSCVRTSGSMVASTATYGAGVTTKSYTYNGPITANTGAELTTSSPVAIDNLTLNNASALISLDKVVSTGTLTLTNGNFITTGTNVLNVTGTTAGSVSRTNGWVSGPMTRALPASLVTGSTYTFPVGKGTYNPLELVNPTTNSGGTVTVSAEVFDASTGGSAGSGMGSLNTNRYWTSIITAGSSNFTNTLLRLNDAALGSADGIAGSSTLTGAYAMLGGSTITSTASSLTTTAPALTALPGFFCMGNKASPVITFTSSTPPASNQCVASARTIVVDIQPGSGTVSSDTLFYSFNGGANAFAFASVSGSTYTYTLPIASPTNATVTWSIKAVNSLGLSRTFTGISYADNPNGGIMATATAAFTSACVGSPDTLRVVLVAVPFTELFNGFPTTQFSLSNTAGTGSATQNSTYYSEGTSSVLFNTASNSADVQLAQTNAINLGNSSSAQLSFYHICALEEAADYGYVQYSTNNGGSWTTFPTSSYAGSGTLKNSVVSFDKSSYSDWNTQFTAPASTPGTGPAASLWKKETINIPAAALSSSQFKIRFRFTTDGSLFYYGWLIDSLMIRLSPTTTSHNWVQNSASVVSTAHPYTFSVVSGSNGYKDSVIVNGCPVVSNTVTVSGNPIPTAPTTTNTVQCGPGAPTDSVTDPNGFTNPTFNWYSAATGGTLLQSSTSKKYSSAISTTTILFVSVVNPSTGCESVRTPDTVTVTSSDTLGITSSPSSLSSICLGSSFSLTPVQSGTTNTYALTWASAGVGSGLTSSTGGTLNTALTITPTVAGTYTYIINGIETGTGCTAMKSISATVVNPNAGITATATATTTSACVGASDTLKISINGGYVNLSEGFEGTSYPPTGWTILNAGTGNNWITSTTAKSGTKATQYTYNASNAADAWLFTPVQTLLAGQTYTVSFWYNTAGIYTEKLRVTAGTAATKAAQTSILWTNSALTNTTYAQATASFTAPTTGTYYFAFNCFSASNQDILYLDDISITGGINSGSSYSWTDGTSTVGTLTTQPFTVVSGATNYVCTTTINNCPLVSNTVTVDNNVAPFAFTAVSSSKGASFCVSDAPTSLSTNASGGCVPYTYNWSGPGGAAGSSATLAASAAGTYNVTVTDNAGTSITQNITLAVNNPTPTVTPQTKCATSTIFTLGASVGTTGDSLFWYTDSLGNTQVGSGTSYTTPSISATTKYFVGEWQPQANITGLGNTSIPSTTSVTNERGVIIQAKSFFRLVSAQYYSTVTSTSGSVTIRLVDSATGTQIYTKTINMTHGASSAWYTMNIDWNIPVGSYRLLASFTTISVSRHGTGMVTYPFALGSVGQIVTGYDGAVNTSYNYFHNLSIQTGCVGTRVPVTATLNTPPALAIDSPNFSVCKGSTSAAVSATAATVGNYTTYSWTPTTGVNSPNASGTTFTPSSTTTYTLSGTDGTCSRTASITITAADTPSRLTLSQGISKTQCSQRIDSLMASGGMSPSYSNIQLLSTSGTMSAGTNGQIFRTGAANNFTQAIYSASELAGMGLIAGDTITAVSYETTTAGSPVSITTLNFSTKWVIDSTFTSTSIITGVVSQSSNSNYSTSAGIKKFTLNSPIVWDGSSHLLIQAVTTTTSASASAAERALATKTNTTVTSTSASPTTGTQSNVRPYIQFDYKKQTQITWSPTTGLFTDRAASAAYTSGHAAKLYSKPGATTKYYAQSSYGICTVRDSILDSVNLATNMLTLASATASGAVAQCTDGGWTYYGTTADPDKLLFAINKTSATGLTGETVSIIVDGTNFSNNSSNGANQEHASFFMKRGWDVTAPVFTGSASVRFYYDPADSSATVAARDADSIAKKAANPSSHLRNTPFTWFKSKGTSYTSWRSTNVRGNQFALGTYDILTPTYGTQNGLNYVEFTVSSFSGGSGGSGFGPGGSGGTGGGVGLPVTWAGFDVKPLEIGNELTWKTASEQNTDYFEIEYSYDARQWLVIAEKIAAAGNSADLRTYHYTHTDFAPFIYYRIKQMDIDGKFDYSAIKLAKRMAGPSFLVSVFPIPMENDHIVNVSVKGVDKSPMSITLTDIAGKVLRNIIFTPSAENVKESLDMSQFTSGVYFIEVQNGQGKETIKISK